MKARLQRKSEDDFGSLWSEALKCCHSLSARKDSMGSPGSTRSSNIRRANTTVQNGLYSKAMQALSRSSGFSFSFSGYLGGNARQTPPGYGSGPGPSSLRPSHPHDAIDRPSSDCAALFLISL